MKLCETTDYREYLRHYIKNLPNGGRGEVMKIAKYLDVQSSMVSQVLNNKKNFSLEQASALIKYLNLNNDEIDYFLLLVQKARSTSKQLVHIFSRQIEQARSRLASAPATTDIYSIPEADRSEFYSAWYYSGVRLATALESCSNVESISHKLGLSKEVTENAVQFLLKTGLCIQKNNELTVGPARTHLEDNSSLRLQHHTNWRIKALSKCAQHKPPEFFYSFPMCISHADVQLVRALLFELIKKVDALVKPSKAENLVCLNIDWFEF